MLKQKNTINYVALIIEGGAALAFCTNAKLEDTMI